MCKYMFKCRTAFEAINLFRKRIYFLTKLEEQNLVSKYDKNTFPKILEYITYTFEFYEKQKVYLPVAFKQELILKFILEFDQVASSMDDMFINILPDSKINSTIYSAS